MDVWPPHSGQAASTASITIMYATQSEEQAMNRSPQAYLTFQTHTLVHTCTRDAHTHTHTHTHTHAHTHERGNYKKQIQHAHSLPHTDTPDYYRERIMKNSTHSNSILSL